MTLGALTTRYHQAFNERDFDVWREVFDEDVELVVDVAEHARASGAKVVARVQDGTLRIRVQDDGVGGARPDGHGLLGLADRLAVLGGRLLVENPADGGTLIAADVPLPA